jgi:hypothetical protein
LPNLSHKSTSPGQTFLGSQYRIMLHNPASPKNIFTFLVLSFLHSQATVGPDQIFVPTDWNACVTIGYIHYGWWDKIKAVANSWPNNWLLPALTCLHPWSLLILAYVVFKSQQLIRYRADPDMIRCSLNVDKRITQSLY